eukprot:186658-Pelagomonas_calceolata.AAC.1
MEVPCASGYTSCKFLAMGWPSIQQLRTFGWLLMRMRRGRRRGGSRRRNPAILTRMGRVGLQAKRSTAWELKVSQGLPNNFHLRVLPRTPTANFSVQNLKATFSIL